LFYIRMNIHDIILRCYTLCKKCPCAFALLSIDFKSQQFLPCCSQKKVRIFLAIDKVENGILLFVTHPNGDMAM